LGYFFNFQKLHKVKNRPMGENSLNRVTLLRKSNSFPLDCRAARWYTKNPIAGQFWRALEWKMFDILRPFGILCGHLVCFMVIWNIERIFGMIYGHSAYIVVIWYMFPFFGMLYQEKSGNLARQSSWHGCTKLMLRI
jgi:hypothetical protein